MKKLVQLFSFSMKGNVALPISSLPSDDSGRLLGTSRRAEKKDSLEVNPVSPPATFTFDQTRNLHLAVFAFLVVVGTVAEVEVGFRQVEVNRSSFEMELRKYPASFDLSLNWTLYGRLMSEWKTGRKATACGEQTWERGLLGAVTAFTYALLTDRAFLISWDEPAQIELFFDSPYIDWSSPYRQEDYEHAKPLLLDPALSEGPLVVDAVNKSAIKLDAVMQRMVEKDWDGHPWASFTADRGGVVRAFQLPEVSQRLYAFGLQPESTYACAFDFLLRPKPEVTHFLAHYSAIFALPGVFSISIQIKTGASPMPHPDSHKANIIAKYQHYFTCADQIATARARLDQKVVYFLVTDSEHLKAEALVHYRGKLVVSGIEKSQMLEDHEEENVRGKVDGLQDEVADGWAQADTDWQIVTEDSNFGKIRKPTSKQV
ncbi:putative glycosyltransferase [Pseudohyphozyma bogoriensis]|nr:putative glycosyltransferase [Pseudohyphozyma bogoriensis]